MTTAAAKYDTRALAVGRAVLRETEAEDVILFGSRARGDYREDSDIDLLLIHSGWQDGDVRKKAHIAWDMAESFYGIRIPVDVVGFTPGEFHHIRHSINSVAAIAAEEGFTMDGQPAGNVYSNDDEDYSSEWTNTGNRCYHARSHLHLLRGAIDLGAANIMPYDRPTSPPDLGTRAESLDLGQRATLRASSQPSQFGGRRSTVRQRVHPFAGIRLGRSQRLQRTAKIQRTLRPSG